MIESALTILLATGEVNLLQENMIANNFSSRGCHAPFYFPRWTARRDAEVHYGYSCDCVVLWDAPRLGTKLCKMRQICQRFHQGAVMFHITNGSKNNFVRLQCILKTIQLEKGKHRPLLIYTFPFNVFTLGLFRFHMYRISLELTRFFSKIFEQKAKMRMGR